MRSILTLAVLALCSVDASAGPLRDRIAARRAGAAVVKPAPRAGDPGTAPGLRMEWYYHHPLGGLALCPDQTWPRGGEAVAAPIAPTCVNGSCGAPQSSGRRFRR